MHEVHNHAGNKELMGALSLINAFTDYWTWALNIGNSFTRITRVTS